MIQNRVHKFMRLMITSITLLSLAVLAVPGAKAQSSAQQGGPPPNRPACRVNFEGVPLTVSTNEWARAHYTFSANCAPVLLRIERGTLPIPDDGQEPIDSIRGDTVQGRGQSESLAPSSLSPLAANVNTCHTKTYETDFAYLKTVMVQNDTQYTWTGSAVTAWTLTPTMYKFFGWWYFNGGPFTFTDTSALPNKLTTSASGNFYCNGDPFCVHGPMYYITLYAYTFTEGNGSCTGQGFYSGTVIPGGHVLYETWKN